ncbi:NDR1/HIN1-like protein 3 [Zea mays]|jgi:hypothetical protein|uniref:Protein YLS9 n=1 Tax=Zea mays TaxID=4577 RepID=A0A1D6MZS9_MAIZE|nr:NDR1/HIN1-like protein 3 [Zea mays]ONM34093.1 Protein YLS9 [Zea mays]|eukprot:XP_008674457.1 NDR1/HIN1-like protein 3 [Zea mays]
MPRGGSARGCCGGLCGLPFTVGLVVLIYWAIFQPHHIRATVDSATLSNLTVSHASSPEAAVSYDLTVSLRLHNPSVRVDIYYDAISAELRFRDAVLGAAANDTSPSVFFQRRKTSEVVKMEFDYGGPGGGVTVARDVAGDLAKETAVSLELDVHVRVRYVFKMFKLRQKPRIRCSISIPVKTEGRHRGFGGTVAASGDRCSVKY